MAKRTSKKAVANPSAAETAAGVATIPLSAGNAPMLDGVLAVARSAAEILEHATEGTLLPKSPHAQRVFELKLSSADRKALSRLDIYSSSTVARLQTPASREPTLWFTFTEFTEMMLALADELREEEPRNTKLVDLGRKLLTRIRSALHEADGESDFAQRRESARKGVYQLRIALADVEPEIWRRFQVEDCNLLDLHDLIQAVMGWENEHPFEFRIKGRTIGYDDYDTDDAASIRLSDLVDRKGFKFQYVYDFGDEWNHEVVVEEILPRDPGAQYPTCLAGEMACPPEDVGGAWGYMEFVKSLKEGNLESEFQDWEDYQEFDPHHFDRDAVNQWFREAEASWTAQNDDDDGVNQKD